MAIIINIKNNSYRNSTPSERDDYIPDWNHFDGYKVILAPNVPEWLKIPDGISVFIDLKCPVNKCRWTTRKVEQTTADLVVFILNYKKTNTSRPSDQVHALYLHESPPHTSSLSDAGNCESNIFSFVKHFLVLFFEQLPTGSSINWTFIGFNNIPVNEFKTLDS